MVAAALRPARRALRRTRDHARIVAGDGRQPLATVDEGEGSAVVLLHGQPGTGDDWRHVRAHLRRYGLRVLVPDRPGYGRTGGAPAGMAVNADAVVRLLDERGVDRAVVAGHSWGGGVALLVAERHPERVIGLVLASAVGAIGSVDAVDAVLTWPVAGPLLALAGLSVLGRLLGRPRVCALLARRGVMAEASEIPEAVRGWPVAWRSFVVEQRALVAELPTIAQGLGRIAVPTTVVVGEADRVVPPAAAHALAAAIPGARLVRIGRTGHLLPAEAPIALAGLVAELAARRSYASGSADPVNNPWRPPGPDRRGPCAGPIGG